MNEIDNKKTEIMLSGCISIILKYFSLRIFQL